MYKTVLYGALVGADTMKNVLMWTDGTVKHLVCDETYTSFGSRPIRVLIAVEIAFRQVCSRKFS